MDKKLIRNFSIIAHIDHGKSTLCDRIIEACGSIEKREMKEQILDSMELERERGITIKLNAVQLNYKANDSNIYTFHLIDTPGHVDFTYEVSRSLAACEGALLVVDSSQGVEAQTLSNVYLALENNLEIIPVINKVDLPSADVEGTKKQIEELIGLETSHAPLISAKTGLNIKDVLESIVKYIPAPKDADDNAPLRALIFDSFYDSYKGAVCLIKVQQGTLKVGDKIQMMSNKVVHTVVELGIRTPKIINKNSLEAGEVGWIAASIKTIRDVNVGDTITNIERPATEPLPGYKKILPMVYCGLYCIDNGKYEEMKKAVEKIALSDAALVYEPETSQALGYGIRCGFLGLLHMDVIVERLNREYNIELIATAPSVVYKVYKSNREMVLVDNPSKLPPRENIERIEEPYVKVEISTPPEYVGNLMELCQKRRGSYVDLLAVDSNRRKMVYEMPLAEIMYDFFDKLKSLSRGYATLNYEQIGYQTNKLVKMEINLNGDPVDALAIIVHSEFAYQRGKVLVEKLKEVIPKHQFEIPIQASIGAKVIARETIKALRKNVLAKCYGGDVTRKKKLLEQQKEGKKKLKSIGSVDVPQEAFIAVLSND
jgi:GTP-binding protein LepA